MKKLISLICVLAMVLGTRSLRQLRSRSSN